MDITERIRPHVDALVADATQGCARAREVISLHRMHVDCPADPGAPALCDAALKTWLAARPSAAD